MASSDLKSLPYDETIIESFLQKAIDLIPGLVVIFSKDEKVLMYNSRMYKATGQDNADINGQPIDKVMPLKHYSDRISLIKRCLNGEKISFDEFLPHVNKQARGSILPLTGKDDVVVAGMVVVFDITEEQRQKEELVRAREEAERANRAKSVFLSNMSHELRTPLNTIMGYAQILAEDPELQDSHKRYVSTINKSGHDLLSLIDDVLEMAKIESGTIEYRVSAVSPSLIVRDTYSQFKYISEEKGLKLRLSINDVPESLVTDQNMIRKILTHFVENSIKFTTEGEIILKLYTSTEDGENYVSFDVKDTGKGIDEDYIDKVFDPFETTAEAVVGKRGTGMGLSISKKYSGLLGGFIKVTSSPGEGSVFRLLVPLNSVEQSADDIHVHELASLVESSPPATLIVDDSRDNLEMLSQMLILTGIKADTASNGHEALTLCRDSTYDIMFLDMKMPDVNGIDMLEIMEEENIIIPRSIIATTAQTTGGKPSHPLLSDYLIKPVEKSRLIEILMRHYKDRREEDTNSMDTKDQTGFIYIIDDSEDNLGLLQDMLSSVGHGVRAFTSAKEALENMKISPPQLVLTDYKMPEMTGVELAKRMQANSATRNIPLLIISGIDAIPDYEHTNTLIKGVIQKPFRMEKLFAAIDKVLIEENQ